MNMNIFFHEFSITAIIDFETSLSNSDKAFTILKWFKFFASKKLYFTSFSFNQFSMSFDKFIHASGSLSPTITEIFALFLIL